jgi:hypothetical protein
MAVSWARAAAMWLEREGPEADEKEGRVFWELGGRGGGRPRNQEKGNSGEARTCRVWKRVMIKTTHPSAACHSGTNWRFPQDGLFMSKDHPQTKHGGHSCHPSTREEEIGRSRV